MPFPPCRWHQFTGGEHVCVSPVYGLTDQSQEFDPKNPRVIVARDCHFCPGRGHIDVGPVIRRKLEAPRLAEVKGGIVPRRVLKIILPEGSLQGSIGEHGNNLLLAYRDRVDGAHVVFADLGPNLPAEGHQVLVGDTWVADLAHPRAEAGREDPRFFRFRGRPMVSFNGLEVKDVALHSQMCVAELTTDLRGQRECWQPYYEHQQMVEKNWVFFEHGGALYAVYSIEPHVVLRMDGVQASEVYRTSANLSWDWGHLRGGAPPVRLGDEYYCFFHGQVQKDVEVTRGASITREPHIIYAMGVYTFEARPPFAVKRFASTPVALPVYGEGTPKRADLNVLFPCGALRRGSEWIVSYGYNDRECRLALFGCADVDSLLRPVHEPRVESVAAIARGHKPAVPPALPALAQKFQGQKKGRR